MGATFLFGRDFKGLTAEQVRQNIAGWQSAAKVPLLIGVDEEGGTVVRASSNPNICDEPYWSPRDLYNAGGAGLVTSVEQDKINTLQNLGINVNFAPVCDISREPGAFMYDRSLGLDAQTASGVISQVVGVYQKSGMGCVLKHFPGYGNNADTHTGIAVMTAPTTPSCQQDFLPFQAGVDAGAGCVLVSHNIVTCKDGDMPASLSPTWHQVLREELGFTGCVITDDLVMDAIQDYCDASSAASRPCWRATTCCAAPTTRPRSPRCLPPWRTAPSRKSEWRNPPCGCSSGKRSWACCETIKKEALRRLLFLPGEPPRGCSMERGSWACCERIKKGGAGASSFCFLETRWLGEWFWERRRKPPFARGLPHPQRGKGRSSEKRRAVISHIGRNGNDPIRLAPFLGEIAPSPPAQGLRHKNVRFAIAVTSGSTPTIWKPCFW